MTIRTGLVGLGRLGMVHAENAAKYIPGMQLQAVCSLDETERKTAKNLLNVKETYATYEEMLDQSNLDAVIIASPTGLHPEQVESAMKKGLHVFCEKPLGLDEESIEKTIKVIHNHPDLVFMLGFMKRYDEHYTYAKRMVEDGQIGEITLIRGYGIDPSIGMESFVKFAGESFSGGVFHDMAIHDIDLARWFTGKEFERVWAIGVNKAYPVLDELGELETGTAMLQMEDGTMVILVSGRNAAHGYQQELEIMGTKGMIRVGTAPEKNLVTVYDQTGMVRPASQGFPERYRDAYRAELTEFVRCIQDERQPEVSPEDGLEATRVALSCLKSFEKNELIQIPRKED